MPRNKLSIIYYILPNIIFRVNYNNFFYKYYK